jgi:DNA-binding transcriptional MerR regulator
MPTDTPYSIADLARLTGVNVRTIRYYLAQGLLPGSGESGPGAHYGEGHLDRLRLTRQLQEQHQPLAEIRRRLAEMTDEEVAGVLAIPLQPAQTPTGSALDYVRAVLGKPGTATAPSPAAPPAAAPAPAAASAAAPTQMPGLPPARAALLRRAGYEPTGITTETSMPAATTATTATTTEVAEPPAPERSQWERLSLGPNVELHIRRPLSRLEQRRVERLITIARQVLKEDAK